MMSITNYGVDLIFLTTWVHPLSKPIFSYTLKGSIRFCLSFSPELYMSVPELSTNRFIIRFESEGFYLFS